MFGKNKKNRKVKSHGAFWRSNGLTEIFYDATIGSWNFIRGNGYNFHRIANKMAENPDFEPYQHPDHSAIYKLAEKHGLPVDKEKKCPDYSQFSQEDRLFFNRLIHLKKTNDNISNGVLVVGVVGLFFPQPIAICALAYMLIFENAPSSILKGLSSIGYENYHDSYTSRLKKAVEKRQAVLARQERKQHEKALANLMQK